MKGKRRRQAPKGLIAGVGMMLMACTSARETNEYNATVPNTIESDADRRAIYNNAPLVKPIQRPPSLNNQASEINRKRNIEEFNTNSASNEPLEVRTRRIRSTSPDTVR